MRIPSDSAGLPSMTPRIEEKEPATLVGYCQRNSSGPATTVALWREFMPKRNEIGSRTSLDLISMRVYHMNAMEALSPNTPFDEWAAVEVRHVSTVPEGMETIELPSGTYAVFIHKGPASTFPDTARHIFGTWLPSSDYRLDARPHLAVMGPDYRADNPEAEEEIWVPVVEGSASGR